jgi:alkylhydroperoxidase/carboxymuconolactone decarboxylase family protein YurZ
LGVVTHMYAPGTQRHIKAALALGASVDEVMDVLKLCVAQGANARKKKITKRRCRRVIPSPRHMSNAY